MKQIVAKENWVHSIWTRCFRCVYIKGRDECRCGSGDNVNVWHWTSKTEKNPQDFLRAHKFFLSFYESLLPVMPSVVHSTVENGQSFKEVIIFRGFPFWDTTIKESERQIGICRRDHSTSSASEKRKFVPKLGRVLKPTSYFLTCFRDIVERTLFPFEGGQGCLERKRITNFLFSEMLNLLKGP